MKYCSVQHGTLLPSPVTSTAGRFCFGLAWWVEVFNMGSFFTFYIAPSPHTHPPAKSRREHGMYPAVVNCVFIGNRCTDPGAGCLVWQPLAHGRAHVSCACVIVTQSCLTLCNPTDCSPPSSSVHGDSPGKNTGVGCHFLTPL